MKGEIEYGRDARRNTIKSKQRIEKRAETITKREVNKNQLGRFSEENCMRENIQEETHKRKELKTVEQSETTKKIS